MIKRILVVRCFLHRYTLVWTKNVPIYIELSMHGFTDNMDGQLMLG